MTSVFSLLLKGCLCSLWLGAWDPSQIRGLWIPPVRRAQLSWDPSCCSRAGSRHPGMPGAGPMAAASSSRGTRHWEGFPALWECCAAGPALPGAEGKEWEPARWLSPGRGDSHQPHTEQLAGNSSFPQISLRKSIFCGRGCAPRAGTATSVHQG